MLVRRRARGLPAELLVSLNGTHVCDFHNDSLTEWTSVVGRVGVLVSSQREAATTGVASTEARARAERELVDCCRETTCRTTACYGYGRQ